MERPPGSLALWMHVEVWTLLLVLAKGEIRCYCDAAHCVPTGYMCKSELSVCFRRVLEPADPRSPLAHGCIEALAPTPPHACHAPRPRNHTGRWPVVRCCQDDMCNYNALHDLLQPREDPADPAGPPGSDVAGRPLSWRPADAASAAAAASQELWFRAAVIAVPIAGAVVLVLLVALALRMLRSESRHRHRQMLARLHYGFHGPLPGRACPSSSSASSATEGGRKSAAGDGGGGGGGQPCCCCCVACAEAPRKPKAWSIVRWGPGCAGGGGGGGGGGGSGGGGGGSGSGAGEKLEGLDERQKSSSWSLGRWGSSSTTEKMAFV